jgi:hypothetical protein
MMAGWLVARRCGWCRGEGGQRICRSCAPRVLETTVRLEKQRDSYASNLLSATQQVERLDRELTTARGLLTEAAVIFKRGRYPRPLSNRITAFLEGL